ncbi:diacylglycerol/lipid kinase family protein [Schaalia suimastitidis]|uniref:diacylglycerol/lipid kinase family protein n=1 Tax=Schaalia suimastitidis TaxID=121163 RepID=UPI000421C334|nr:diacylglycerol kinase family protein [Schaalia suimastitidis]
MPVNVGLSLGAVALVSATGFVASQWYKRRKAQRTARKEALLHPQQPVDPERGRPRPWIILNPSKIDDVAALRERVNTCAAKMGVPHVHWRYTTVEDPGTGQAIQAIADGASVVIAAGGDGTVRAVAAAMAGSGVRMGIMPVGTGNLMARNLGIPLGDVERALSIALGEGHRAVDLGWLRVDEVNGECEIPAEGTLIARALSTLDTHRQPRRAGEYPTGDEYSFLVVAGIGFDGQTMADTDPELKKMIGWPAYVIAGLGATTVARMHSYLTLLKPRPTQEHEAVVGLIEGHTIEGNGDAAGGNDDAESTSITARSVLFANCGELPLVTLAPEATVDDGLMDVVAVDTQAGMVGWADLAGKIFAQGLGIRPLLDVPSVGQIAFRQARGASLRVDEAQVVQVDGDAIASARVVEARIESAALDIAVPTL